MTFNKFKKIMDDWIASMVQAQDRLFIADIDTERIWDLYLESFPPGTNEIFRERREHDCSCCRHFIKRFGNIVSIKDNNLVSIWDFDPGSCQYRPVVNALSKFIKRSIKIKDLFVTKESVLGTLKNHELLESGDILTWEHLSMEVPDRMVSKNIKSIESEQAKYRDVKQVLKRSLEEITQEALTIVLDLIEQGSLYRGEEWKSTLQQFGSLLIDYTDTNEKERDNFCWHMTGIVGPVIGKIRNHSIGTLLVDISNNEDLDEAVRKYDREIEKLKDIIARKQDAVLEEMSLEDLKEMVQKKQAQV